MEVQTASGSVSICIYPHVFIKRGVSDRRWGSDKISKTLQEGGKFLLNGGSDYPKMSQ